MSPPPASDLRALRVVAPRCGVVTWCVVRGAEVLVLVVRRAEC
jgi:hypothetical protein